MPHGHRDVGGPQPRRQDPLRDRVAAVRQRRPDPPRDQRRQHHDQPRAPTTSRRNSGRTRTLLAAPIGTATSEQLFQLTFAGVTNNVASPYLDYDTNQLFFGDSGGRIHRVTNVNTTAAVARYRRTSRCPAARAPLQSPVFVNGQVIVTSADGRLYRINTDRSRAVHLHRVGRRAAPAPAIGGGGLSAPVVDVTNNKILVDHQQRRRLRLAGHRRPST